MSTCVPPLPSPLFLDHGYRLCYKTMKKTKRSFHSVKNPFFIPRQTSNPCTQCTYNLVQQQQQQQQNKKKRKEEEEDFGYIYPLSLNPFLTPNGASCQSFDRMTKKNKEEKSRVGLSLTTTRTSNKRTSEKKKKRKKERKKRANNDRSTYTQNQGEKVVRYLAIFCMYVNKCCFSHENASLR